MFERQAWMQRAGEYPESDQEYFALLSRAVFSAGLGPRVVESRWQEVRASFRDFQPAAVWQMQQSDVESMLVDPKVIRNRRKIEAVIGNASVFLDLSEQFQSFHLYLVQLGASKDLEVAADTLSRTFAHLGRTSALFFLFSAGWRAPGQEVGSEVFVRPASR
jgi:DNA-3-methyladenine glycosylase I